MPKNRRVQVLRRAVHIMELIGNSPRGLRLMQVADTLCLPKQTAHKIMDTLVVEGLLAKSGRPPQYELTDLMSGLRRHQQSWHRNFLMRASLTAHAIYKECRTHIILSQLTGGEIVGRLRLDPERKDVEVVSFTGRMSPYGTGLVFQAYMTEEELRGFRASHPLSHDTEAYWGSYELLDEVIVGIRRDRYLAIMRDHVLRVIVPVQKVDRRLWGALTLLRSDQVGTVGSPVRKWITVARKAADDLSVSLAASTGL